jgi:hypothetical protein
VGGRPRQLSGDQLLRGHASHLPGDQRSDSRQLQEGQLGRQPRIAGPARHVRHWRVKEHQALDGLRQPESMHHRQDAAHRVPDEDDGTLCLACQKLAQHAQLPVDGRRVRRRGEGAPVTEKVWHQHPSPFRQEGGDQSEVERGPTQSVKAHHHLGGVRFAVLRNVNRTFDLDRARPAAGGPRMGWHQLVTVSRLVIGEVSWPAGSGDLHRPFPWRECARGGGHVCKLLALRAVPRPRFIVLRDLETCKRNCLSPSTSTPRGRGLSQPAIKSHRAGAIYPDVSAAG